MTAGVTDKLRERSIAVILESQAPSGAFVAGPGFSQYGYVWFRDGSFIAAALDRMGHGEAAARFHHWAARIVLENRHGLDRAAAAARDGRRPEVADYLHCRYAADGSPAAEEWPSFQLDGPGIWLWSLARHVQGGGRLTEELRVAARGVGRYLAELWRLPSFDAWEEFPDEVHTSTLAAILAGLRALEEIDGEAPERVAHAADEVERTLRTVAEAVGYFPKWRGSHEVDASLLWLAVPYELVDVDDQPFAATLGRIERDLVAPGGGVYRYRADTYYGGGAWVLLAASLARVYLRRGGPGDVERAERIRRWIEAQADAVGHLPEQVAADALQPEAIDPWRRRWGESARPLIWSHAFYLELIGDLATATA